MNAGADMAALGFFAMILAVMLLSDGGFDDLLLAIFFAGCCFVSVCLPPLCKKRVFKSSDGIVLIRHLRISLYTKMFVTLEKKIPILRRMRLYNESIVTVIIPRTGTAYDAEKMATVMTRASLAVLLPAILASVVLAAALHEIFLVLSCIPIIIFFVPVLRLKLAVQERKSRIEEEMAYFLSFVNIMQTIGLGLYNAFEMIRGEKTFPGMEKDASEIVKRVKMIGITQNESLDIYAKHHPSSQFRDFVSGYVAKITSIGNVPAYTESKAKYFFDEYVGAWYRYEKSAQEIFGAIIMIAVVLPMMMMFNALLGTSSQTAGIMLTAGMFISPLVAFGMITMLNSSQPATGNKLPVAYPVICAGGVVGMAAFVAGVDAATSLALACLVAALANYALVRRDIAAINIVDSMIPEFMRDVTEMSKTGQNINQIVMRQAEKKAYARQFNVLLSDIARKVRSGRPFDAVVREIRSESTHVRFIMFLLAKTYVTGGGSTDVFFSITEFVTKIHQTKKMITKGLKSMSMIVYFSPFLMLGTSHIMISMFAGMDAGGGGGGYDDVGGLMLSSSVDESLINGIALMSVMTTVPIGVVAAKISSYTIRDTLPVAVVSLTTIIAIHMMPAVVGMFNIAGGNSV